jgi:hypothetical protein
VEILKGKYDYDENDKNGKEDDNSGFKKCFSQM